MVGWRVRRKPAGSRRSGVGDGGGEPEAFGGGVAVEALEDAVQLRAGGGGGDGEAVAFVVRAGFGTDLVPGDSARGVGGGFVGGVEHAQGEQKDEAKYVARHGGFSG